MSDTRAAEIPAVLSDELALQVFAAVALQPLGRTEADRNPSVASTRYLTTYGAARLTGLPQEVTASALRRLEHAGLVVRFAHGDGWRTDASVIAEAANTHHGAAGRQRR